MRRRDDRMMRAIREADPAASPQVADWAETSEAALIAERIRAEGDRHAPVQQPKRRRPSGRLVIVIALVVVAVSAIAASVAVRSPGPSGPSPVVCFSSLEAGSGSVLAASHSGLDPVDACRRIWPEAFGEEAPAQLVTCVEPRGGFVVYPLPRGMSESDACDEMGVARYVSADAGG